MQMKNIRRFKRIISIYLHIQLKELQHQNKKHSYLHVVETSTLFKTCMHSWIKTYLSCWTQTRFYCFLGLNCVAQSPNLCVHCWIVPCWPKNCFTVSLLLKILSETVSGVFARPKTIMFLWYWYVIWSCYQYQSSKMRLQNGNAL